MLVHEVDFYIMIINYKGAVVAMLIKSSQTASSQTTS